MPDRGPDSERARGQGRPQAQRSPGKGHAAVDRDVRCDQELVAAALGVPAVVPVPARQRGRRPDEGNEYQRRGRSMDPALGTVHIRINHAT